jgi:hypothetical protein
VVCPGNRKANNAPGTETPISKKTLQSQRNWHYTPICSAYLSYSLWISTLTRNDEEKRARTRTRFCPRTPNNTTPAWY